MRKSLAVLTLSLVMLTTSGALGAELLLFNVSSSNSHTEVGKARQIDTSRQTDDLTRALISAGYQPNQLGDDAVSFTMNVNEVTVPVVISNVGNGGQKRVTLMLSSLAKAEQFPKAALLKLLSSNNSQQPAFFAYNKNSQQIQLHRVISAENARGIQLRDELDNLTEIASETETMWNIGQVVVQPEGEQVNLSIRERGQLPVKQVSFTN